MRGTTWLASGILGLAIASPAAAEPECFNRANLRFNRWFLEHVLEPTARGYNFVVPKWGQRRVVAFMGNLEGPRDILNSLAQAKLRRAGVHSGRLLVNTTAGVVGLFDVAGDWLHWTASPET
ncbi:MAG: VacJ family lipoprotein, partial [Deltaproteobacteria bacterium]